MDKLQTQAAQATQDDGRKATITPEELATAELRFYCIRGEYDTPAEPQAQAQQSKKASFAGPVLRLLRLAR